jgi:hypothetical protein
MNVARMLTRCLLLTVALVLMGALAAPVVSRAPAHSPYVSALGKLTAPAANAASCPLQKCATRGHNGFVCIHAQTFSECLISGSSCNTQSCVIQ